MSSVSLPQRSQRLNTSRPFLLVSSVTATSLDLFRRSFLGCVTEIWNATKLDDIRSTIEQSSTKLASGILKKNFFVNHIKVEGTGEVYHKYLSCFLQYENQVRAICPDSTVSYYRKIP